MKKVSRMLNAENRALNSSLPFALCFLFSGILLNKKKDPFRMTLATIHNS
jgi:hypothetical protein